MCATCALELEEYRVGVVYDSEGTRARGVVTNHCRYRGCGREFRSKSRFARFCIDHRARTRRKFGL